MKLFDRIPLPLDEYSRLEALRGLHQLYERIESGQSAFNEAFATVGKSAGGLSCPAGCGSCCEGFVPDILPLEAEYLAAWLLARQPDRAQAPTDAPPPCPFYDRENGAAHCSVYPARPLVCRLFAFTASRDKDGQSAFALCRHMPSPAAHPGRQWSGAELEAIAGQDLRTMADYAFELIGLVPEDAERRAPIGPALEAALARLRMVLAYSGSSEGTKPASTLPIEVGRAGGSDSDGDEPEPNAPAPQAA